MVDKKLLTMGEFRAATADVSESVQILVNAQGVTGVHLQRNAEGDLQVNLLADAPPTPATAPSEPAGQRANDPATLTDEEREQLRLTEKLGGVEERRSDPDVVDVTTGTDERDGAPTDADLGDKGSEDSAL